MSNIPVPELPGNMVAKPIHQYAYQLNLEGIQLEVANNIDNLNIYSAGAAEVHPLYMVFLRIDNEKPTQKLLDVMDYFLMHPKLSPGIWSKYTVWFDGYGNQISMTLFGLFLMKTIDKQEWYTSQFIKCLLSGADIRFQFGIKPLMGIRYRDYILAAPEELYSSLMIKTLLTKKNATEQLTWKADTDTFEQSLLAKAVSLHKNTALYMFLEAKLFSANTKDEKGMSVLHYCAIHPNLATYSILLEFGADVNDRSTGSTALEEFLKPYMGKELNPSEKNLIWNMCIVSNDYGYTEMNQVYEMVSKQLGEKYYLPIQELSD
jgi:hypothetical protein